MKKGRSGLSRDFIKISLFAAVIILLYLFIPKAGKFKYDFEKNRLWKHDDLISPFSFAIKKSQSEIDTEYVNLKKNFSPLYTKVTSIKDSALNKFSLGTISFLKVNFYNLPAQQKAKIQTRITALFDSLYKQGIIQNTDEIKDKKEEFVITVLSGNQAEEYHLKDLLNENSAKLYAGNYINNDPILSKTIDIQKFFALIKPNLIFDQELSDKMLNSRIADVSLTKGLIQEGEKIISKGNIVTPEKYQTLESLKDEYEATLVSGRKNYNINLGYLIIIILTIGGLILYLHKFYPLVYESNKKLAIILSNILLFVIISAYIVKYTNADIYFIPYCLVPLVLLAIFDTRIAFFVHLMIISIVSLFAPNSFEFLILQLIAGLGIVVLVKRVRYLSDFFIASLLIFLVYNVAYLALKLFQINSIKELRISDFSWFAENFILTLLAYPLIYAHEKIFGFVSDITLMELADINKPLLKELAEKSPGTFHHSLQVANLSESILNQIGGDALLARVGALYHDIGKTVTPQYFIENQQDFSSSLHDKMDEKESAGIIINHVTLGVELAKKYKLPRVVVDFIVSHHGTSRTEFFYRNYLTKNPDIEVNEDTFRYSGIKPTSKEMAVVMIVDGVEASSRSLKIVTPEAIDEIVERIVQLKIADKQLEQAEISLYEISVAKSILKNSLKSIYHNRIEYPNVPTN
jgi:putative nucleotidyltransferase with HDIG domain